MTDGILDVARNRHHRVVLYQGRLLCDDRPRLFRLLLPSSVKDTGQRRTACQCWTTDSHQWEQRAQYNRSTSSHLMPMGRYQREVLRPYPHSRIHHHTTNKQITYYGSHTYPRPHPAHLAGRQEEAEETPPSDLHR